MHTISNNGFVTIKQYNGFSNEKLFASFQMHLQPMSAVGGVAHGRPCPLPTIRLEWRSRRIEAYYSLTDDTTTDLRAERLPPPTRSFPFLFCADSNNLRKRCIYLV